jgi:hypothetical protein
VIDTGSTTIQNFAILGGQHRSSAVFRHDAGFASMLQDAAKVLIFGLNL